jgi:Sec-independent protein translocase protein TatA
MGWIGLPELIILIFIVLLVFRAYRYLPQLGRSSGKALRVGSEKAKELSDKAGKRAGDKFDPGTMGRKAGEGMREAREFRDSFKGALDPGPSKPAAEPSPEPSKPASTEGGDSTRGT